MKHLCILILLQFVMHICMATDYYISSSNGDDANSGLSENEAWQSLEKLSSHSYKPGDKILLRSGDIFEGGIYLENVRGLQDKPVIIGKYGGEIRPVINGKNVRAAIYMLNPAYIKIENIEVTNPNDQYGILMEAKDAGELKNVILTNLDVHDVFDEAFERTNTPKTRGGIVFEVNEGDQPTWWNGIIIENSKVHDLGSCGITIGTDYKVNKHLQPGEKRYPILGVRIRNNVIHDIVRDGAIIRQCKGGIMENNEVYRTGLTAVSNGMWFYDSDSCIIQHNVGHHCKAAHDKDGAPFSIDNSSTNCIIQFNYSHSNEGAGYMLFGHDGNEHGNVIRHNISYNDATNIMSDGVGSIAIVSTVKKALVADNIIIAGPATKCVLGHRNWDGLPEEVDYQNNLFVGNGTAFINRNVLSAGNFKDNFFINISDLPDELKMKDNRVSNYYQKLQEMIIKYDSINAYNINKY